MKSSDLNEFRPVKSEQFIKFTPDHLHIAGNEKTAGLVYAALEFKAELGGKGDSEFLNINISKLRTSMGGFSLDHETIRSAIKYLIDAKVLIEGPRGVNNTWNLRIDRQIVSRILRMNDADRTAWFFAARARRAELLQRPSNLRKTRERIAIHKTEPAKEQNKYVDDKSSGPEVPVQNLSRDDDRHRAVDEDTLRSEVEYRTKAISALPGYSKQTVTNLLRAVAASPDKLELLEQIEQDCRDFARGKKPRVQNPCAWVVDRAQRLQLRLSSPGETRRAMQSEASNPRLPDPPNLASKVNRLDYSPEQIRHEKLQPASTTVL